MDAAKAAVKDFMSKSGHHDTTVHEKVAPAMTHETITKTQHDNVQTAIDKEVHQDHYHTSVQPINNSETLAESHHHKVVPVEHRSFEHDNADNVKQRLATEQAKFRDEQTRVKGEHTSSVNPVVAGEHVHHHVHETIQPVINKQTIEPHVVHTTVPIHEVHHNAAKHHATSALPAVSMEEFKKQGGVLTGREERYDGFQGEPRTIGGALSGKEHNLTGSSTTTTNNTSRLNETTTGSSGLSGRTGEHGMSGGAATGALAGTTTTTSTSSTSNTHKPSLMDKLNPKKDADRDGKPGFMD